MNILCHIVVLMCKNKPKLAAVCGLLSRLMNVSRGAGLSSSVGLSCRSVFLIELSAQQNNYSTQVYH